MLYVLGRQAVWPARWGRLEAVWVGGGVQWLLSGLHRRY
jgi:hypothetical protein